MRQNCLPHTVYLASRTQISSVAIAAITHAWATHCSDANSSLPQSSVGSNIPSSTPATYPDKLEPALQTPQLRVPSGSSRHSPRPTSSRWRAWKRSTVARWLTLTRIISGRSARISS